MNISMIVKCCRCCNGPAEHCKYIKTLFEIGAYEFIPDFIEEREFPECTSTRS